MARTQSAAKAQTPAAVKAAAVTEPKAPRVHRAKAGTVEGPKGKNMPAPADAAEVTDEQRKAERRQADNDRRAQFAPTTQTAPAVHEPTKEEKKAMEFQQKMKELAEQYGVDPATLGAPKQAKAPRGDKQQQNGITRPAENTKCGLIWGLADKISHDQDGHPASIAQLKATNELKQMNDHTLKTQYARWRAYNGVKGRVDAPAPAAK